MKENLIQLYNTLLQVEVKGNSVKLMANSLLITEDMIMQLDAKESAGAENKPADGNK